MKPVRFAWLLCLALPASALASTPPSRNVPPPKVSCATFPAMDAGSKDPAKMKVKTAPEHTTTQPSSSARGSRLDRTAAGATTQFGATSSQAQAAQVAGAPHGSSSAFGSGGGARKVKQQDIGSGTTGGSGAGKIRSCSQARQYDDEAPKETKR